MENKLEQLLNSLIEKGWKPFGEKGAFVEIHRYPNGEITTLDYGITWTENPSFFKWNSSIRDLVSKGSGLWQFVCENGMVSKQVWCYEEYHWAKCTADKELIEHYSTYSIEYEYRLIEASLKDENELEDFLLNSIKLD